jgi:hypothetical protein
MPTIPAQIKGAQGLASAGADPHQDDEGEAR